MNLIEKGSFTHLTVIATKKSEQDGIFCLDEKTYSFQGKKSSWAKIALEKPSFSYSSENLQIHFMYLSKNNSHDPIKILIPEERNQTYSFHYAPPTGWMNDPNGLCYFKGYWHIFYQFNPADTAWGNPYWGHAASRDLIHWEDYPIALAPHEELSFMDDNRGGAYSGTAKVINNRLYLFFTRHIGDNKRTWCSELPWLFMSDDGFTFTHEINLINHIDNELDHNFRDPKVIDSNDGWLMLHGGRTKEKQQPAIPAYFSKNLLDWTYNGLFFVDAYEYHLQAECPDCFDIGNKTLLIVGYINRNTLSSANDHRRDVICYIGNIVNNKFVATSTFSLDYGRDFYAPQSFNNTERHIILGWVNDLEKTFIKKEGAVNGLMSIPREISIKNSTIVQNFTNEILTLFDKPITINTPIETNGHYHATIHGKSLLELMQSEKGIVSVAINENSCLEINIFNEKIIGYKADSAEIFVDANVIEISIPDSEYFFTRLIYAENQKYVVKPVKGEAIVSLCNKTIWEIK